MGWICIKHLRSTRITTGLKKSLDFTIPSPEHTQLCSLHAYNKGLFCIMPAPIVLLWAKYFTVSHSRNNVWLGKAHCHKSSDIFKSKLCGENWHGLDSNFLTLVCLTPGNVKLCFPQPINITKICSAPIQLTLKTERQLNKTWSEGCGLLAMYLFENIYSATERTKIL